MSEEVHRCISTARSVNGKPDQINESTSNNGGNSNLAEEKI